MQRHSGIGSGSLAGVLPDSLVPAVVNIPRLAVQMGSLSDMGIYRQRTAGILITMDHLEALQEKIARLRSEIADIQELNDRHRFGGQKGAEAGIAHSHRQERLEEIQAELVQLSELGRKTLSIERMREKHRSRLHLVKNAS